MSTTDEPQVSWKAIEANAQVFSSEGEHVGKVSEVVGDSDADVFSGLAVSLHLLGSSRFLPSERVRAIWPDRVESDLTKDQIENLDEHQEQVAERIQAPDDFMTRVRRFFGFYGTRGPRD